MTKKVANKQECDIAIIGAGPAGISSAIRLKITNPGAKIIVIEKSAPYNKIGSVIRKETLGFLEELNVDPTFLGTLLSFGEDESLIGINRLQFENGLRLRALSLGIDIVSDLITNVAFEDSKILYLKGQYDNTIHANFFIDASGQVALIPKAMGARSLAGPQMTAAYAYFHSNKPLKIVKNARCTNGLVWITPVPYKKDKETYQVLFLSKEGIDPVDHRNYLRLFPELKQYGLKEGIYLEDPCGVLGPHVRQYPAFIYNTTQSSGTNWTVVGDANSIIFDKVFSGVDQALQDGLTIESKIVM